MDGIQHNINIFDTLHKNYRELNISKLTSKKCSLKSTVMNKAIKNSGENPKDAEKAMIKVRHRII